MADQYEYLSPSGVVVPDTADVQATVEQEYRDALGQALNVTQGPQQVLIAAEVTARTAVLRNNAALANQINPDLAGGVFLDALMRLTGSARRGETYTVLKAVALSGQPGTVIPAGSIAKTATGDQFASTGSVTLSAGGVGAVDFVALTSGPVTCAPGALSTIVTAVLGWETVSNPAAAIVGQTKETDGSARLRRRNTLALQAMSYPEAITSALYDVSGVRSLRFLENKGNAVAAISGINVAAHGVWLCVDGGTDADVAAAILRNSPLGCDFTGATSVNVTETVSGQVYAVKFDRPTAVPFLVRLSVRASTNVVGDPIALAQTAVMDYVNGLQDGEPGFVVGGSVSPFELAGAINREVPGMYVQKVEVTKTSVNVFQTTEVALAVNELATLTAAAVTVNLV